MFSRQNPSSRASLSDDWILACPSKILAFSLTSIDRINGQIFVSAFSAERCVFLSNKRMNRELNLPLLLTIHGTRTLERGRLVSIRWLENLDHMALARGKTKNEAAVCVGVWWLVWWLPWVTQHPPQALRFSHGFAKRRARNASDWCYFYWDTQREPLRRRESGGSFRPSEGSPRPRANFFSSYLIHGEIRCIALCLLPRAIMGLWLLVLHILVFLFRQSS